MTPTRHAALIAEAEAEARYQEIEAASWAKRNAGHITHRAGRHAHTRDILTRLTEVLAAMPSEDAVWNAAVKEAAETANAMGSRHIAAAISERRRPE